MEETLYDEQAIEMMKRLAKPSTESTIKILREIRKAKSMHQC